MKKTHRDIIILKICTINNNHMMYYSWDMERGGQKLLSFSTIFCPFTPLTTPKIKTRKNEKKKTLEVIIILQMCTKNNNHMIYDSWEVECNKTFCHFGPFFALLSPNNLKNQNFVKNEKTYWRYYHFTHVYHKQLKSKFVHSPPGKRSLTAPTGVTSANH